VFYALRHIFSQPVQYGLAEHSIQSSIQSLIAAFPQYLRVFCYFRSSMPVILGVTVVCAVRVWVHTGIEKGNVQDEQWCGVQQHRWSSELGMVDFEIFINESR